MSACPEIALSNITPEKLESIRATAQSQGLDLTEESGSTSYMGLEFTWTYDSAAESLTIQCTAKPAFVPCSMIESRIRALVA